MGRDLYYLGASAILTIVMLLVAAGLRTRAWTNAGSAMAFGNRDDLPPPTPLSGRAQRAAANMLEGMLLFVALVLAAQIAGVLGSRVALGAALFFWARLVYFPVYLAGIAYLRTAVWAVSIIGLAIIFSALIA
ncbi:MAG: MAPEG family protein [Burkholderiaceae bacterium]